MTLFLQWRQVEMGLPMMGRSRVSLLAALIVGVVFAVVAIGLALFGRSKASLSGLEPTRTERQLRQDAAIITERVDA